MAPPKTPRLRGQTALEYVMIIGGAILFVVIIVIILRSGILRQGTQDIEEHASDFQETYLTNYLVYENFDSGTSKKWTEKLCTWQATSGKYVSATGDCISIVQGYYDNFTLEFKVRRTGGAPNGEVGAIFRSDGTLANSYAVVLGNTDVRLLKDGGGVAQGLHGIPDINAIDTEVKVKAYSTHFDVYVNGAKIFGVDDATHMSGRAGVLTKTPLVSVSGEYDYFRISR